MVGTSVTLAAVNATEGQVTGTHVVDCDDAAPPNELQGFLIVIVVVEFVSIDEHKVESSSLTICN